METNPAPPKVDIDITYRYSQEINESDFDLDNIIERSIMNVFKLADLKIGEKIVSLNDTNTYFIGVPLINPDKRIVVLPMRLKNRFAPVVTESSGVSSLGGRMRRKSTRRKTTRRKTYRKYKKRYSRK